MTTYTHKPTGRQVRIVGQMDSDPRCRVWVCFVDDPDTGLMVKREEIGL